MIVASDPFDQFIADTFAVEGAFSDDPQDPGNWTGAAIGSGILGGTRNGIASSSYALSLRLIPDTMRDNFPVTVKDLTDGECRTIYQYAYWLRAGCDKLPPALAIVMGDGAVNQGIGGAVQCLQEALSIPVDGDIGPQTLAAVTTAWNHGGPNAGAAELCAEFIYRRLVRYMSGGEWTKYGHGWSRRLLQVSLVSGNYLP